MSTKYSVVSDNRERPFTTINELSNPVHRNLAATTVLHDYDLFIKFKRDVYLNRNFMHAPQELKDLGWDAYYPTDWNTGIVLRYTDKRGNLLKGFVAGTYIMEGYLL